MKRIIGLVVFILAWSSLATADTIVPDRPGFSTGTYTVKPGKLNVEMGYDYSSNARTRSNYTQTLPLLVLRTGITENIELDIMGDGWNLEHSNNQDASSVSDITIGGKYRLYKGDVYNLTLMGLFTIPVGGENAFVSQNIIPFIALLWDYTLTEELSLFGTLQATTYYDNERVYDIQPAVGLSIAHTEKFSSFVELYSIVPFSTNQNTELVVDGGFIYLLTDDIQLDINLGLGLNENSDDFIGCGVAIRF